MGVRTADGDDERSVGLRSSRGVGLLEMVLVLALASILLGAAWPSLAGYLDVVELRSATLRFSSALARGRVAALTDGRIWKIRLAGLRDFVLAPDDGDAHAEQLPGTTFFAAATSGGDVRFYPSGLADNATFTLGAGDARRRVIVNQRGRVTIE